MLNLDFLRGGKASHKVGKNAQSGIQIGPKLTWKWPLKNALKKFDFSSIHHYRGNERLVRKMKDDFNALWWGFYRFFHIEWSSLFRSDDLQSAINPHFSQIILVFLTVYVTRCISSRKKMLAKKKLGRQQRRWFV